MKDRVGSIAYVVLAAACVVAVYVACGGPDSTDSTRQMSMARIGPERDYVAVVTEGDEVAVQLAEGVYRTREAATRRSVPWALSPVEQVDLFDALPHGDHEAHGRCGRDLLDRIGDVEAGEELHTAAYLHWAVRGDELVVDRVAAAEDGVMDDRAAKCFEGAFLGEAMPASSVPPEFRGGGFFTEWSICLRASDEAPTAVADTCWELYACNSPTRRENCATNIPASGWFRDLWELSCPATPYPSGYQTTEYGRGCRSQENAPAGTVGADGCMGSMAIVNLGLGRCWWRLDMTLRGPGCCIVGCPHNLPGCRPELRDEHHH